MDSGSTASPPTSRLRFLDAAGVPIPRPAEWSPALVEVLGAAADWDTVRLWRQDEILPVSLTVLAGEKRVVAAWPRSDAGHYRLRLDLSGDVEEQRFAIEPRKITTAAYARLLEDLETRLPAAVALALQRAGALAGVHLLPPGEATVAQELVRLRRATLGTSNRPGLADVLIRLAQAPHRVLDNTQLWVPQDRARRPHPARLVQALARPHNLDAASRLERVIDARPVHTADVYENRLLLAYHQQVALRLRRLIRTVEAAKRPEWFGLLAEAQSLLDRLLRARRQASFLDEVNVPSYVPTQVTMVLLNRPAYRAALEGYLELHRSATVRLEEPAFRSPAKNLPRLYQTWGTLEVLLALLDIGIEMGYTERAQRLIGRDVGGVYVRILPDGEPAVVLVHSVSETVVKLIPERSYGRNGPLRSISFQQRPDVAVEVQRAGDLPVVYLFDPKYKLDSEGGTTGNPDGKPLKVDIDKMHAYRDAIRDASGNRMVRYAGILYPGPLQTYYDGIEALPAYPGAAAQLEQRLREVLRQALVA